MKNIYDVTYQIQDKGVTHPEKTEEITVSSKETVEQALRKHLNRFRHAQDLSKKFEVTVIDKKLTGYA